MQHSDFRIGAEFRCGGRLWRCTARLTVSRVPSQGDGQGESQRSNLDVLAL